MSEPGFCIPYSLNPYFNVVLGHPLNASRATALHAFLEKQLTNVTFEDKSLEKAKKIVTHYFKPNLSIPRFGIRCPTVPLL
jgi:hypothetical protein